MKSQFLLPILVVLLHLSSCSSSKTTPETTRKVTQQIENKDFSIKVNYAVPMRMKQVYLTSDYDVRIKNDSAFAFLPYYGVAHVAPMNTSEGGIRFAEQMTDYTIRPNKKHDGWEISFKVKTREYHYQLYLSIFNNGSSSVTINSYERDAISFYGELK
ncbi:MAG: DUF4251 domain-containing protein [Paludibacter sp.]|nr:DUF4251 domain-containing protein [Paludibacter sp.]